VTVSDVVGVLKYVGTYDNGPPNGNGVGYDSLKDGDWNGDTVLDEDDKVGRRFDRSPSATPSPPHEAGAPDGYINVQDMLLALAQVSLACGKQPAPQLVAEYTYDGQGALVKRTTGDGSWTVYVGGIYEAHDDETYVKYYSAFGRRIAMRDNAGMVHYILSDHLGSSTTITDASGGDLRTMNYYPYGAERSSSGDMITDKLFTGRQKEPQAVSTLGLYNYGARFYSTLTGRFLSPDPLIASPGDPQALNRYSYVRDNPLVYVDPMGLTECIVCGVDQNCEGGGIGDFKAWVISYWIETGKVKDEREGEALWRQLNENFAELTRGEMIERYDVFFVDTSGATIDAAVKSVMDAWWEAWNYGPLEVVLGFSKGGVVVYEALRAELRIERGVELVDAMIRRVILVQPALNQFVRGPLDAEDLPDTRIMTVNAARCTVGGEVKNAIDVTGTESGDRGLGPIPGGLNHGTMSRTAPFVMHLMFLLPTTHSVQQDLLIVAFLQEFHYGIENEWSLTGH
jgi:RHS repeat-associated protein